MSDLGLKIKRLREEKKLTQAELAGLINEKQQTIGGWEKGRTKPGSDQILTLAKVFGLTANDLFNFSADSPSTFKVETTPYYPEVNASAGLNFINQAAGHYSIPISIPNVKADAFINVFGDSMYPKYCSGEIIGIKEIEKDMVMFGHAYVIQMSDGEAYLKYIKKGTNEEKWLLVSENEHYEPREFHLKYIEKVFIIKATISRTSLL
jgi:phage repressor protein C with HTH and peptisase S24 domain